jgi:branched-subunit amino acid transport protein
VTAMIIAIVALALMNFAFKAVGPALLGDREFPPRVQTVIEAFSPALLAGLLVVELVGQHWALFDWTTLPGLLAAAVTWRLGAPHLVCIAVGVAVTVLARLAGTLV